MFAPAVVIHRLDHARRAVVASRAIGRPVCLLSAPAAGQYAGVAWWRALVSAALTDASSAEVEDLLDCGDAPGSAMAALRHGQRALILDPSCPAFAAVAGAASTLGARVLADRPRALDLALPGAALELASWLGSGAG